MILLFRFCVVYFTLYALATQIFGGIFLLPGVALPALGTIWPMRDITFWWAERLFGATPPLIYRGNSGDTLFHWVQMFWLLGVSLAATVVWSMLDRRGDVRPVVYKWFRVFIRFALAAQMFYYGMAKVVPTQFPPPSLVTLVEPVGNLSLADMLWTFIGSSTPYQMFTGFAELLGGILLLVPQTTPLGALVALADMIQVFLLNMTYDFGLKQMSFHLILMALFLLACPERSRGTAPGKRLLNVLVHGRAAAASDDPPLFTTARANRIAIAAQVVFGVYLMAMFASIALRSWYGPDGPGSPRSVLYGIWDVDEMSVDGQARAAGLNDYDRQWRRVIFDAADALVFQRTDDSFAHFGATVNTQTRTVALRKGNSRTWRAEFTYIRPADDQLILAGEMDDRTIRVRLKLVPLDTFRLLNSRFRWVRPPDPFAG